MEDIYEIADIVIHDRVIETDDLNKLPKARLWNMTSHDAHYIRVAKERREQGALIHSIMRRRRVLPLWAAA